MIENIRPNVSREIRSLIGRVIPVERISIDKNPAERSDLYARLAEKVALGILKETNANELARQYCDCLPKRWVIRKFW